MKRPPVDFRARTDELRALALCRPRQSEREIIMAALHGPYEGLASIAAQTLGKWGDRESVAALHDFWKEVQGRKNDSSLFIVIARALGECVQAEDADWSLDLYFDSVDHLQRQLLGVVIRLPVESTRRRFLLESRSRDHSRRLATLLAMGRMPFPDRRVLIRRFQGDEDAQIRKIAVRLDQPILPGEK